MAFCSNCGEKAAEGAKFCQNCGHPLQGSTKNAEQRQQEFVGKI